MDPDLPKKIDSVPSPESEIVGLTPSNWVNFMTPEMVFMDLEELEDRAELRSEQVAVIKGMIDLSQGYYGLAKRRDGFRTTLLGHVLPGMGYIVKNKEDILGYYERRQDINRSEFTDEDKQDYLFHTLALFVSHDWLEDASEAKRHEVPLTLRALFDSNEIPEEHFKSLWADLNAITKPNKAAVISGNREALYAEQLTYGSDVVAVVKLIDRTLNHFDDFGSIRTKKVTEYIEETSKYLQPFFESRGMEGMQIYDLFVSSKGILEILGEDAEYSDLVLELMTVDAREEAKLDKLYGKRQDAWEHIRRMISVLNEMYEELQIKPTPGFKLAIISHDILGNLLDKSSMNDKNLTARFSKVFTIDPELVTYALGVARSAYDLEKMSEELRRDPIGNFVADQSLKKSDDGQDNKPIEVTEEQKRILKGVYSGETITSEEFEAIRRLRPTLAPSGDLLRALDQDIEGAILLAIEKLDNIENPPKFDRDGYVFRAANEILYFLVPLLQTGGLNKIAQKLRGKALEKLVSKADLAKATEIHESYDDLYNRFLPRLAEDVYSLEEVTADASVTINRKALGSIARSVEKGEYEDSVPDDIVRSRVVFPMMSEEKFFENSGLVLRNIMNTADEGGYASEGVKSLTIEHPDPKKRSHGIKVMGILSKDDEDRISNLMANVVSPEFASVRPSKNDFKSVNVKIKMEMLDGTFKYMEMQFVRSDWHYDNSLGKAAHVLFKQGVMEPSAEHVQALQDIYMRHLIYWLLPNAYVLSSKSQSLMQEYIEDLYDLFDGDVSSSGAMPRLSNTPEILLKRISDLIGDPRKVHRFLS